MSDLRHIIGLIGDTDDAMVRFERSLAQAPRDDVAQINAEALRKRRGDLERRLAYELSAHQHDFVIYKVKRTWSEVYPARAVAASLIAFQELVTSVFDALRTAPKQRYRPSPENIELSTLEFAAAGPGSVLVCLSIPNDRLLAVESDLDRAFDLVARTVTAGSDEQIRELVTEIGIASVSKAYAWAETSVDYGLDTTVEWGKSPADVKEVSVSREHAQQVREMIERISDEENSTVEADGVLWGHDGDTSYFHFVTAEKADLRGDVSPSVPKQLTTGVPYHARLMRTTRVRYATGEEKLAWTLLWLERLGTLPALNSNDDA